MTDHERLSREERVLRALHELCDRSQAFLQHQQRVERSNDRPHQPATGLSESRPTTSSVVCRKNPTCSSDTLASSNSQDAAGPSSTSASAFNSLPSAQASD